MKKQILTLFLGLTLAVKMLAGAPDEGMWLPMFIERLNYVDMQKMGLRLTAEELYSINNSSLKDAIVSMQFFCTGEIISKDGLMLTNHHCGYDAIQKHSTIDHDYLTDGFWAMTRQDELPNSDLTASFLVRMEDVTSRILDSLNDEMSEAKRKVVISKIINKLKEDASEEGKYEVSVKDFFEGNEYYLFVYETFKDVRLVGAPPSAIGKFGGDTDNWMWPRHTGDFCLFRIYTAPDGSPAEYAKENIPLKPKHHLPISLKGVQKDDFAMVWGFPGTTERFLTSYGVKLAVEESNPAIVKIRDKKLEILRNDMDADPKVKIQYATKYAQTSNFWKYFIGQTKGLKCLKVYDKKLQQEEAFKKWINTDPARKEKYGKALNLIKEGYEDMKKINLPMKYMEEAMFQGPEFLYFSFQSFTLYRMLEKNPKGFENMNVVVGRLKVSAEEFFKDYNMLTDKKLFAALLEMYYNDVPAKYHPEIFSVVKEKYKGDFNRWADHIYSKSIFVDQKRFISFLEKPSFKVLDKDPGFAITLSMINTIRDLYGKTDGIEAKMNKGHRLFVDGLRQMNPDHKYYPDANSSMRMTYGKVLDYYPADAVYYDYITTLEGIIEKEDPKNDEFIVPKKLKELYKSKDYGRYGEDGKMIVCFITNTDITGGNSGSPVINADGHLIGVAFDGNWEAMSGDIAFEPELQRTINVDIRYVLFVIDKFAGATHLIDEMTIIE